ncbi:MAG: tetratricopeptide repeat protein [Ignavibacteria bacterium]|nr:tetratricopeptide repeat protein [Ignavibacteria bacterium]
MKSDADSLVSLGVNYIYNVKFSEAENCFRQVQKIYPNHPVGYFLDAMVEWWKILLLKDETKYDKIFLNKIQKVIDISNTLLKENPKDINALFFKAGAIGFRGRYYTQRESWLNAVKDGAEGYDLLIESLKIAPGNHDIMLGTGIYNYFASVLPEKYPIIKPLATFLPRGDRALGILQLNAAARSAKYANIEAKVVLLQIYYSFENDIYRAEEIINELYSKYPDNPYFHRYLGRIQVRRGYYYDFEQTWREILKRCMAKQFGYERYTAREAMYYIGVALFERGDYENALKYFYKCDEGSRILDKDGPSGFMVMANLYAGKILDIQGKRNYAIKQYEKILKMKDYNSSHETARYHLNNPFKR